MTRGSSISGRMQRRVRKTCGDDNDRPSELPATAGALPWTTGRATFNKRGIYECKYFLRTRAGDGEGRVADFEPAIFSKGTEKVNRTVLI